MGATPTHSRKVTKAARPFRPEIEALEDRQMLSSTPAPTLEVDSGDRLYGYVHIDPANRPSEIMLQWHSGGSWEHRAYWGTNLINLGTDGSASRRSMGALPQAGGWVRLEVPADAVGLAGATIDGMSFTQFDGRATWDQTGKTSAAGDVVWFDDVLPPDKTLTSTGGDGWNYVTASPAPFSGSTAHQSNVAAGLHQHSFIPTPVAPAWHSLPQATFKLYLDFNGDNVYNAPVFDMDGNSTSFNAQEVTQMQTVWQATSDFFAPFNVDVTTEAPPEGAPRVWVLLQNRGGPPNVGGTGGDINSAPARIYDPFTLFVTAHEAGHSFGLMHQSDWNFDANGRPLSKIREYSGGRPPWKGPIMGIPSAAVREGGRATWWKGPDGVAPQYAASIVQDDAAVIAAAIARNVGGDGYRALDRATSFANAVRLNGTGDYGGVITTPQAAGYYVFTLAAADTVTFSYTRARFSQNLDARLELYTAAGQLLASVDPAWDGTVQNINAALNASLTRSLAAGTYYVAIKSHGEYGDVGPYVLHADLPSLGSNRSPTVATAAAATPSPVTGTTTALRVVGSDDGGEASLRYTWSVVNKPARAADPTFSANYTNAAKNSTATFSRAGAYTLRVTMTDNGGLTTSSDVTVVVNQVLTRIDVSPATTTVLWGSTSQLTAVARDQFGAALTTPPAFTWTVTGAGSVDASGRYTAPASDASATIRAASGAISGTAVVQARAFALDDRGFETVRLAAGATRPNVAGSPWTFSIASGLHANGAGFVGPAAPEGAQGAYIVWNGTISQSADALAGTYTLRFKAAHFNRRPTFSPATPQKIQVLVDGNVVATVTPTAAYAEYSATFTLTAGRHTLLLRGLNTTTSGYDTAYIDQLEVTRLGGPQAPTVAAAARVVAATATTAALSVLGADDGGEAGLRYTWSVVSKPAGATDPTFSANGANAAKNTTATFGRAGTYVLRAAITDAAGLSVTSDVSVTVNQVLTRITVAPATAAVPAGGTRQFTAAALDQFGQALATQPAVTWSLASGVGAVSTTGLYSAPVLTGGGAVVRAASGAVSGTATVTVTATGGLVGHWKFDDGSGTQVADAAGGNPGTLVGNPAWTPGRVGGGLTFGGGNFVQVADSAALRVGQAGADFSVAFWMRVEQAPNGQWRALIHKGSTNYERTFALWLRPGDQRLHFRISTTASWNEGGNSVGALALNQWTHVAYVKAGNRLTLYLNGIKDSEVTLAGTVLGNTGPLYVGKDPWYGGAASSLDDLRIYNRALTAAEVQALGAGNG